MTNLPEAVVEKAAAQLWFEHVDRHGYPNGLPAWPELAADDPRRIVAIEDATAALNAAGIGELAYWLQQMCEAYAALCEQLDQPHHRIAGSKYSHAKAALARFTDGHGGEGK